MSNEIVQGNSEIFDDSGDINKLHGGWFWNWFSYLVFLAATEQQKENFFETATAIWHDRPNVSTERGIHTHTHIYR